MLTRTYSSHRAFLDHQREVGATETLARRTAVAAIGIRSYGAGFAQDFEHWLIDDDLQGTLGGPVYVAPSGTTQRFSLQGGAYVGEQQDGIALAVAGDSWRVTLADGTSLAFEREAAGSRYHRLLTVTAPSGEVTTLRYYGPQASSPCTSSDPLYAGKACEATRTDGAYLRFTEYDATHGRLRTVEYGRAQPASHRVRYTYATGDVVNAAGSVIAGLTTVMLTRAAQEDFIAGAWTEVDAEAYEYTRTSYYRPDLGTSDNPYQVAKLVVSRFDRSVQMMRRARDFQGHYLSGHEVDSLGRAATSTRTGEFLRLAYERVVDGEWVTRVWNESAGTYAEYRVEDELITEVSDDCQAQCNNSGTSYAYDAAGHVVAQRGFGPDAYTTGVRTTLGRDAAHRVTLEQENHEGTAGVLTTDPLDETSPFEGPVRVTRTSYAGATGELITERSRVFSSVCRTGATSPLGLTCPGDWSSEEPRTRFDYDTDYDAVFNEAPGTLVTQEAAVGLTLSDLLAGTLARTTRLATTSYAPGTGHVVSRTSASVRASAACEREDRPHLNTGIGGM